MAERTNTKRSSAPSSARSAEADVVQVPESNHSDAEAREPSDVHAPGAGAASADEGPGTDVARALQAARLARGITIEGAAEATCIRSSYLAALESDEPVSAFPAPAYGRFFLREYAQYLRLDAEDLVDRFVEHHGIVDEARLADAPAPLLSPRARWPVRIFGAISIVILVLLATFAIAKRGSHPVAMPPLGSASAASGQSAGAGTAGGTASQQGQGGGTTTPDRLHHIRAELDVATATWVRATVDGNDQPGRIVPAGRSKTFRANKSLVLRFADPAGITRLRVNGKPMTVPGTPGAPAEISLRLKGGKVTAR